MIPARPHQLCQTVETYMGLACLITSHQQRTSASIVHVYISSCTVPCENDQKLLLCITNMHEMHCTCIGLGIDVDVGISTAYISLSLICMCLPVYCSSVSAAASARKGGNDSPASVSSMWTMKIERELRLPPLSPAEREVAHPFFFSRANTLPSPSCPSRWLHTTHDSGEEGMALITLS